MPLRAGKSVSETRPSLRDLNHLSHSTQRRGAGLSWVAPAGAGTLPLLVHSPVPPCPKPFLWHILGGPPLPPSSVYFLPIFAKELEGCGLSVPLWERPLSFVAPLGRPHPTAAGLHPFGAPGHPCALNSQLIFKELIPVFGSPVGGYFSRRKSAFGPCMDMKPRSASGGERSSPLSHVNSYVRPGRS